MSLTNFLEESPDLIQLGLHGPALDRIGSLMETLVCAKSLPGATTLVSRKGQLVWWKGCGVQNPAVDGMPAVPLGKNTLYRIYSMTKPITSVAIMMLVERGQLLLHQPAHLYLGSKWTRNNMKVWDGVSVRNPEYVACERAIRIKDLLTHTAGLSYGFEGAELFNPVDALQQQSNKDAARRNETLAEFVDRIGDLPLSFQPGTRWNYSVATDILGRIVEVVSGEELDVFLSRHIFAPLGMTDTFFHVPDEKAARLSNIELEYKGKRTDVTAAQRAGGQFAAKRRFLSGGGGLVSSMPDYLTFAQCMLNGGSAPNGYRLIGRHTLDYMTTNHLPAGKDLASSALPGYTEVALPGVGFGLGFSVIVDPALTVQCGASKGTFAWGGLANTAFWCDPSEQLLVVFMTQVIGIDRTILPLRDMLSNIVSGALVDGPTRAHARM